MFIYRTFILTFENIWTQSSLYDEPSTGRDRRTGEGEHRGEAVVLDVDVFFYFSFESRLQQILSLVVEVGFNLRALYVTVSFDAQSNFNTNFSNLFLLQIR